MFGKDQEEEMKKQKEESTKQEEKLFKETEKERLEEITALEEKIREHINDKDQILNLIHYCTFCTGFGFWVDEFRELMILNPVFIKVEALTYFEPNLKLNSGIQNIPESLQIIF